MYRGDTPAKTRCRKLVWGLHKRLLGEAFLSTPHVFTASRFGGDIEVLLKKGVPPDNVWAVDTDQEAVRDLIPLKKQRGFRLFPRNITQVVQQNPSVQSVYLDLCGHLKGRDTRMSITETVRSLPRGSVLSVTLLRGREQNLHMDREQELIGLIQQHTKHPVTLLQALSYLSNDHKSKGSPMITWTFVLREHKSKVRRVDLSKNTENKSQKQSQAARKAWETRRRLAAEKESLSQKRSQAAHKAWETRRRSTAEQETLSFVDEGLGSPTSTTVEPLTVKLIQLWQHMTQKLRG